MIKLLLFLKKFSLKTQLLTIITIIFFIGSILVSIVTYHLQNYYFYEAIYNDLNALKFSIQSGLYHLIISHDYDKIEKFLLTLSKHEMVNSVSFIDKNQTVYLEISKRNNELNIQHPFTKFSQNLREYISEDEKSFFLLFSIKDEIAKENLAWIQIIFSKEFLKNLQRKSFETNLIFLTSGWLVVLFLILIIFEFYIKDLKKLQSFLLSIPQSKGNKLNDPLFSSELNSLRESANNISKFLYIDEKKIKFEKERLEKILSSLSEGIVLTDEKLIIHYANPVFCYIIGCCGQEDLIGKELPKIIPLDLSNTNSSFWEIFEGLKNIDYSHNQFLRHEAYYINFAGEKRIIELNFSQILFEEKVNGYVFTINDITQRKSIEKEIIKLEKFETINRLAGGVAHDLNNLLAVIFNYINLFKLKMSKIPVASEEKKECEPLLKKIEKSLYRAKNLSLQLLTLSKEGVPIKEPQNIEELIQEVAEFCFSGSPVSYEIKVYNAVSNILIDPSQMAQVFQNLFINAREVILESGKVLIEISLKKLKNEEIPPLLEGEYIEIKVSDNGPGIPPDILTKIFEPFFTTKEKGTGLGLSIVYQIIKNHGGNIIVESELGKGTTFKIYIPYLTQEKIPLKEKEEKTSEIPPSSTRILIIDDEEELRETLKLILTEFGFIVETAENGKSGIEKFYEAFKENKPFNIVIVDYILPDLTGEKILNELKTIYPDSKIILSTGYTGLPITSKYKDFGFCEVLIKPYTIEKLLEIINKTISS